jgi:HK97 family phage major capsid protein/HK97 family phage prohead protease
MKLPKQFRAMSAGAVRVKADTRTVEFPFSSEFPVDRWFGKEVLSHDNGCADLARLNDGGALLFNHKMDTVIGVVERAWLNPEDKRVWCEARFSNNAKAEEVLKDIQDGILKNVSFGYQIKEMKLMNPTTDAEPEYLATKWMPYEVSIVSIPADPTVGIGRSDEGDAIEVRVINPEGEKRVMNEEEKKKLEAERKAAEATARIEAKKEERERAEAIRALGEKFGKADLARQLIESDTSLVDARAAFLEQLGAKQKPVVEDAAMLDLTEQERMKYSLVNAIRAQIAGDWSKAGFERECSQTISKQMGKESSGFFMPLNVKMDGKRAPYAVGAAGTGGNNVATNLLSDSFIEMLRNKMLIMEMGAKVLSGLVGNIAINKQATAANAFWVAEAVDVTESEGTFAQVTMGPKTVGALSQMSRLMLLQSSPDIEMLVRSDLAAVLALAIDSAAISGSGSSGQPRGILNQSGIGSVAMGTNGAAFTNIDPLIDLETLVATANADFGQMGYLTNAKQVGILKKLKATTNEYLWNGYAAGVNGGVPGEINGYRVGRSNQVPATLTKGTASGICSAAIFGNFNDLIIGQWGPGVEILANPFGAASFASGGLTIRALASVDVAVRNAVSFAAITDLL